MLTIRNAAPALLLAMIALIGTPGGALAADTPGTPVSAAESSSPPADAATPPPHAETPTAAQPQAALAATPIQEPVPAATPIPVPAATPIPVPAATTTRPANEPVAPRRAATTTAVAAKPRTRAPAAAKAVSRPPVPRHRLTGRLELAAGAKQAVAAGEVADGVVYFLPKAGGGRPQSARFIVDTQSKGFNPSLLVVPVGSMVSFPNRDQILHNVFSKTPGAAFDLGYYGPGQARETRFSKPGLVVVNCSVHNAMRSNVLVLSTPYYVRPGRDGRFSLDGLPPGPGTLVFWHPRASAQSLAVTGPVSEPVLRRLVATRAPLAAHRR